MAYPTVHLYGNLESIVTGQPNSSNLVSGAKVRVELSNYGPLLPRVQGATTMLARGTDYAAVPSTGLFETYLYRNDLIYPLGTFYTVIVEDEDGNVIQCGAYRFNTDGEFDLSLQTPIDAQAPPPPLPPSPPYSELLVVAPAWNMVFDGSNYTTFQTTLPGNVNGATIQNMIPGNLYTFIILQDATGGHIFQFQTGVNNATAVCPVANSTTIQTFVADENGILWAVSAGTWLP